MYKTIAKTAAKPSSGLLLWGAIIQNLEVSHTCIKVCNGNIGAVSLQHGGPIRILLQWVMLALQKLQQFICKWVVPPAGNYFDGLLEISFDSKTEIMDNG
jgi:hypothetical protein